MTELKLNKTEYGSLGSVVYFGQVLGSICAAGLMATLNAKIILTVCLICNILALLVFTLHHTAYWHLVLSRMLTGLF